MGKLKSNILNGCPCDDDWEYDDGCPCNNCLDRDGCDTWEMQFCCTYCHWCGYEQCDDCDPMDI